MRFKAPKHKHEIKEDKFITAAFVISEFFKNHWKKLLAVLVGVLVIIIIVLSMGSHQKSIKKQALRQFDVAMSYYSNNDFEKAEKEFNALIENYSSIKEHNLAYLYLAKICLERDSVNYTQAKKYFEKAASKIENDILRQAAMIGIAECYLGQNNEEEYYSYLEKAAKKFPHSFQTPQLLFEIAEYYFEKNNMESAKDFYSQIVEKYETSSVYYKAKNKLSDI